MTLRIGFTCMRASSPAGFLPESEFLHAVQVVLVTLPGLRALQQDPAQEHPECLPVASSMRMKTEPRARYCCPFHRLDSSPFPCRDDLSAPLNRDGVIDLHQESILVQDTPSPRPGNDSCHVAGALESPWRASAMPTPDRDRATDRLSNSDPRSDEPSGAAGACSDCRPASCVCRLGGGQDSLAARPANAAAGEAPVSRAVPAPGRPPRTACPAERWSQVNINPYVNSNLRHIRMGRITRPEGRA